MFNRRDFIKFMSLMGGVVLNPFQRFGNWSGLAADMIEETFVGELYGGFVLLPDGVPLPYFVEPSLYGGIFECGVGIGIDAVDNWPRFIINKFANETDMKNSVGFPLYSIDYLTHGIRLANVYSVLTNKGELLSITLCYESYDSKLKLSSTTVSLAMYLDFMRPFPLYYSKTNNQYEPARIFEEVNILSNIGFREATMEGFVYYWIDREILYVLTVEPSTQEFSQEIIGSLKPV
jgi:hypothetical protein